MENHNRRRFLEICLGGIAVASASAVAYPVFRYLSPLPDRTGASKITIPENEIREGDAKFFQYADSAAVLVKTKGGDLIALSAVCTHLGCIVQWQKEQQQFLCPCHAGHYTAEGEVISGPPPKPLQRLTVTVANGTVTVG